MNNKYLYLDESGDPGWPSGYGGKSSRYFIYSGVTLTGEQNYEVKDRLTKILSNHFRDHDTPEEVHYADAVHANGKYSQLSDPELSELRDDIFNLILDTEPTLMASVVDKVKMKERYGSDANNPKRYGLRATVDRFHKHLDEHDSVGTITIDSAERTLDRQLRELIYNAQEDGISLPGARYKSDTTLPRIMDTITMTPSEMSPGIQLADVVAYQVYGEYTHSGSSHGFESLEHLFRDPSGTTFTEPSVFPE
ncbi:MAG: DUF3800 domain-containing protein [Halococcoides sp.]